MALFIDQDVSVVAVLNLQDVRNDSVGSQRRDEVVSRVLELNSGLRPVPLQEVLVQVDLESLA